METYQLIEEDIEVKNTKTGTDVIRRQIHDNDDSDKINQIHQFYQTAINRYSTLCEKRVKEKIEEQLKILLGKIKKDRDEKDSIIQKLKSMVLQLSNENQKLKQIVSQKI